ncbi:hypothetical protein N5P18_02820 [Janibacter terrae]|uniref:Uncharacterized protein n=1 Tax=Janibacter terrae TaxID=103817 RepID=A0ABZ2FHN7_9MICO
MSATPVGRQPELAEEPVGAPLLAPPVELRHERELEGIDGAACRLGAPECRLEVPVVHARCRGAGTRVGPGHA